MRAGLHITIALRLRALVAASCKESLCFDANVAVEGNDK
jgi:hypothetical protein